MDYIIVMKNGNPVRFSNGDVVIYGDYTEALLDFNASCDEEIVEFKEG